MRITFTIAALAYYAAQTSAIQGGPNDKPTMPPKGDILKQSSSVLDSKAQKPIGEVMETGLKHLKKISKTLEKYSFEEEKEPGEG